MLLPDSVDCDTGCEWMSWGREPLSDANPISWSALRKGGQYGGNIAINFVALLVIFSPCQDPRLFGFRLFLVDKRCPRLI